MYHTETLTSERLLRLSKEGLWIIIGQAAFIFGSLFGVRILTQLLEPAAYGELALGMTIATLVNQTILGPLGNGISRFYAIALEKKELGEYLAAVGHLLFFASGAIVLLILLTVISLQVTGQSAWISLACVALIYSIVSGYNSILNGLQNASRQRAIVAIHQGLEPWARFLIAAGLLSLLGPNSTTAMMGYVLAICLALTSQYILFRKAVPKDILFEKMPQQWIAMIWNYSWPFSTWGIFTWAQLASDRWALGLFASMQEVGFYSVLFQLGYYPMSMITSMSTQFMAPILYQLAGNASDSSRNATVANLCKNLTLLILCFTGVVFLAVLLFHKYIFMIFAPTNYHCASHLLPWVLLAGGVFAAAQTLGLNLMSQMKTKVMISVKIGTALLGILLNFIGAHFFGISGVVTAGLAFSSTFFICMLLLSVNNQCPIHQQTA